MVDVFISYARESEAIAKLAAARLTDAGFEVWWDTKIPAHRAFGEVIEERLTAAKAVVVLWSRDAVVSDWVRAEAGRARVAGKLIQALLDDASLPMPFDHLQRTKLRDWKGEADHPGWRRIEASVRELVGAEGLPPVESGPKPRWRPRAVHYWTALGLVVAVAAGAAGFVATRKPPTDWNVDGLRIVADTTGMERRPALSRDGRFLAYGLSAGGASEVGDADLVVRRLPDGEPGVVAHEAGTTQSAPAWSPDGSALAYVRTAGKAPCALMVRPYPVGQPRTVGRCRIRNIIHHLDWSADGKQLIFSDRASKDGPHIAWSLSLATGQTRPLTSPPKESLGDFDAALSPDGRSLAFVRHDTNNTGDVFVQDLASGRLTRVSQDKAAAWLAWASDGRSLFVTSSRGGGPPELWAFDPRGKASPRRLQVSLREVIRPSAAPGLVAVETLTYRSALVRLKPSGAVEITSSTSGAGFPTASSQGVLAYGVGGRRSSAWIQRPGQAPGRLAWLDMVGLSGMAWSPDGRSLATSGVEKGVRSAFVIDVESGTSRRVATPGVAIESPSWSPDGVDLVFSGRSAEGARLWRVPANGSAAPRPVSPLGWFRGQAVPGGGYIGKRGERGLWRLTAAGQAILIAPEFDQDGFFEVRGDKVYYADKPQDKDPRLWVRPVDGGPARLVAHVPNLDAGLNTSFTVDPATGEVIYIRSAGKDVDIGLINVSRRR